MKKIIFIIFIVIIGITGILGYIFKKEKNIYRIENSFGPKLPIEVEYNNNNINNINAPKLPIIN